MHPVEVRALVEECSGAAAVLQVLCILASALLFFSFRSPGEDASGGGYYYYSTF